MDEKELKKIAEQANLTEQQVQKLRDAFKYLAGPELKNVLKIFEKVFNKTQDFEGALKDATDSAAELGDQFGYAYGQAVGLYSQLRDITSQLKAQGTTLGKIRSAYKASTDIAQKLSYDAQGIVDLDKRQLGQMYSKAKIQQQIVKENYEAFLQSIKGKKELSKEEQEILSSYKNENKELQDVIDQTEDRLKLERLINKNMGVTGALVQGAGALMERLGMRTGIFHQAMEDSAKEMRRLSKEAGKNASFLKRMSISAKGLSILIKGFGAALVDAATIGKLLLDSFLELDKSAVEFRRLTGQNASALAGMNDNLVTSVEVLKQMNTLSAELGYNVNGIFTPQQMGELTESVKMLGLTDDQAKNLGKRLTGNVKSSKQFEKLVDAGADAFTAQTGKAVNLGQVLKGVNDVSDSIALSLGNSPQELGRAVAAAQALGMSLGRVDQIAEGLLDFESSINAELEAQLLTGGRINLGKARELALNNDLVGLSKEIANNNALSQSFGQANRIQQESMAKALGMSRDELAKMIIIEKSRAGLSAAEVARQMKVTPEMVKQLTVQQKFNDLVAKLGQAAAPILDILHPVADLFVAIFSPLGEYIAQANQFVKNLTSGFDGITKSEGFKQFGKVIGAITGTTIIGVSMFKKFKSLTEGKLGTEKNPMHVTSKDGSLGSSNAAGSILDAFNGRGKVGRMLGKTKLGKAFRSAGINLRGRGGLVGKAMKGAQTAATTGGGMMTNFPGMGGATTKAATTGGGMMTNIPGMGGATTKAATAGAKGGILGRVSKFFKGPIGKIGGRALGPILAAIEGFSAYKNITSNAKLALAAGETVNFGSVGKDIVKAITYPLVNAAMNFIPGFGTAISITDGILSSFGLSPIKFLTDNLIGLAPDKVFEGIGKSAVGENKQSVKPQEIPQMAEGGIVTQPTKALIGEAGAEAVIPLREFYAKMDELIKVVKQGGNVYMDGNKIGHSLMMASTKIA